MICVFRKFASSKLIWLECTGLPPFFSQLTEGISTECTRQGCALHISYFYETMDIDSQLDALRAVDCESVQAELEECKNEKEEE